MTCWDELYPDHNAPLGDDLGDEMPTAEQPWRPTVVDNRGKRVGGECDPALAYHGPRPVVTAWEGADLDAYWLDGEVWRHCQTGKLWVPTLGDVTERVCADILNTISGEAA